MNDRLIGIPEAAQRLGYHPNRLRKMCREQTTPVRAAKRDDGPKAEWVFSERELNRYIEGLFKDDANIAERPAG